VFVVHFVSGAFRFLSKKTESVGLLFVNKSIVSQKKENNNVVSQKKLLPLRPNLII
jgi:hypothetical protein